MRHDTLLPRLARAAQPGRPLLRITLPPRLARFLIAAGARAASNDSMTVHPTGAHAEGADGAGTGDRLPADRPSPQEDTGAENAEIAIITADPSLRLAARPSLLPLAVVTSDLIVRLIELAGRLDAGSADTRAYAGAIARDLDRALDLARPLAPALDRALDRARDHRIDPAFDPYRASGIAFDRDLARNLALGLKIALDRARALAHDPHLYIAVDIARTLAHNLTRAYDVAPARAHDRDLALDLALDLARAYDVALDRDLARARDLDRIYVDTMSRSLGLERVEGLAAALLNGALDDFTHADLSNMDLSGADLTGVRWSMTTQWPPDIDRDALLRRSGETAPGSGIYVISPPDLMDRAHKDVDA